MQKESGLDSGWTCYWVLSHFDCAIFHSVYLAPPLSAVAWCLWRCPLHPYSSLEHCSLWIPHLPPPQHSWSLDWLLRRQLIRLSDLRDENQNTDQQSAKYRYCLMIKFASLLAPRYEGICHTYCTHLTRLNLVPRFVSLPATGSDDLFQSQETLYQHWYFPPTQTSEAYIWTIDAHHFDKHIQLRSDILAISHSWARYLLIVFNTDVKHVALPIFVKPTYKS